MAQTIDTSTFIEGVDNMKILLAQPYGDNGTLKHDLIYKEIQLFIEETKEQIDLIIFPEAFEFAEDIEEQGLDMVIKVSKFFNIPVLMGISGACGTEEAYYFNPHVDSENPKDDSYAKLYIKHSTSPTVYFDIENSEEIASMVYCPIILKGKVIQVCICHDMFYPLLMERLHQHGMDMLINLTGGNVKLSKWNALLKGRSLEIEGPVICTMSNRPSMGQKSDRIVFDNGKQLKAKYQKFDGVKNHAYSIFDLNKYQQLEQPSPFYSDKKYDQLTIGFQNEDIIFTDDGMIEFALEEIESFDNSLRYQVGSEIVHVHIGMEQDLYNRVFVFNEPRFEKEHHVFIYVLDKVIPYDEAVALAKLRAIENRIAVVIKTPKYLIGAKTNRYKDVQLFTGRSFGFDLQHMYGFDSVYEKNKSSMNGININHKEKYEAIIDIEGEN